MLLTYYGDVLSLNFKKLSQFRTLIFKILARLRKVVKKNADLRGIYFRKEQTFKEYSSTVLVNLGSLHKCIQEFNPQ